MGVQIPTYPNPYDPANPYTAVYGKLAGIFLDVSNGSGRGTLSVHPNPGALSARPLGHINFGLGEVYRDANPYFDPPLPEIRFPTLDELLSDPEFQNAWNTVATKLYSALIAAHPALADATISNP